jgi:hypothetical protein
MQKHTLGRGQERTQALDAASRDCIGTASMPISRAGKGHQPGLERGHTSSRFTLHSRMSPVNAVYSTHACTSIG